MKLKFSSKFQVILIGIFLVGTMLINIFAAPVLQAFSSNNNRLELPKSNVIDYRINPQVADFLLQNGITIITFEYNIGCRNCIQQKSSLEYYANQYKEQIFLEEIVNNTLDVSKIRALSVYGNEKLTDANETGLVATLCKVMISPPIECALVK